KAISEEKSKRKADEALALAQGERQKAEAEARATALAAGFVIVPSSFSVPVTVERLEDHIRSLSPELNVKLIRRIDLAVEAEKFGAKSLPRMVVDFGDPRIGARHISQAPTSAMEAPIRVVVWQDHEGKVWLAYRSAEWLQKTLARHGIAIPRSDVELFAQRLNDMAVKVTQ